MEQGILPSRKELLSRIELVCDLDSSLISVTGEAGIGKSALLEFFIEHHCRQLKKCFVGAQPDMAPYQVRESILSQLVPGSTFDSHLSLAQNLTALAPEQTFTGIFILDNAQYVADEVFYDLIDLMDDDRYQFSVIYAQERDDSRQADLNARKALIEIHPEPLDVAESKLLLQFYHGDMSGEGQSQVKQFVKQANGNPASLLQWQQNTGASNAKTKQGTKKTKKKDPKNTGKDSLAVNSDSKSNSSGKLIIILCGGLLLTVAAIAAWYFKPPSQQDIKEQLRTKVEQQNKTDEKQALSGDTPNDSAQINEALGKNDSDDLDEAQPTNLDDLLAQSWDDDREIKPEHQFDSPEEKNAQDPKVIEVIKLDSDDTPVSSQANEQATVEVSAQAQEVKSSSLANEQSQPSATQTSVVKTLDTKSTVITESPNKLMDNEWFLAQAATGAMVQLAGLSEKRVLEGYLVRYQLKDSARIYQSIRNGKPWYVVTIGPFANMNEARTAINQLSQTLQDTRPWAKSIKAIQSEIVNANN